MRLIVNTRHQNRFWRHLLNTHGPNSMQSRRQSTNTYQVDYAISFWMECRINDYLCLIDVMTCNRCFITHSLSFLVRRRANLTPMDWFFLDWTDGQTDGQTKWRQCAFLFQKCAFFGNANTVEPRRLRRWLRFTRGTWYETFVEKDSLDSSSFAKLIPNSNAIKTLWSKHWHPHAKLPTVSIDKHTSHHLLLLSSTGKFQLVHHPLHSIAVHTLIRYHWAGEDWIGAIELNRRERAQWQRQNSGIVIFSAIFLTAFQNSLLKNHDGLIHDTTLLFSNP